MEAELIFAPRLRKAERVAICRSCDSAITKGTEMISFFSYRNRGMNIHLCIPCSIKIGKLAGEVKLWKP